jgi:mRNA interferase RelE/StbE
MAYTVEFSKRAFRNLESLPKDIQKEIRSIIDYLEEDPRPNGITNMTELDKSYRLRIGDYRIVYSVLNGKLFILILSVGDRKDVYSSKEIKVLSKILKEWLANNK